MTRSRSSKRWMRTATVNLQPSILNPPSSTLNPQPSTINPQPPTLNPQPTTLNPQPSTLNPQPSTLNAQPSTRRHLARRIRRAHAPLATRRQGMDADQDEQICYDIGAVTLIFPTDLGPLALHLTGKLQFPVALTPLLNPGELLSCIRFLS